ncbi:type IV pilus inner membrane component PilO [Kineococcus arenarius]|uniref:type 4a pilus biogenesis protein PilO n=1 Tax=unclassified Kineococcus TaxID=2621656 RepID=UPI003D7D2D57
MSTSKTRVWAAGTAAVALLILVASWFLVLAPQRAQAGDLATEANQVEAQNEQVALKTEQLAALAAQLPERQAELERITASLPAEGEIPDLIRSLSAAATSTGVVLNGITPSTAELWDTSADAATSDLVVVDVPVSIEVEGSFTQTELYLKQLQADATRFFLVESVELSTGATDTSTSADLNTTITGKVFALRDTTVVAEASTAESSSASATPATTATPTASATASASAATSTTPTADPTATP